jgi:hypothetical protein
MSGTILWNAEPVPFRPGETVAQALTRAGVRRFGSSRPGSPHAVFCGIGQCQNCLVVVAGRGAREACILPCSDGLELSALHGGDND